MKTHKQTDIDAWLDGLAVSRAPMRDASRLRAIGIALTELERAQENLDRTVHEAKEAGESWAAISVVLGTSRQAAHKRFGTKNAVVAAKLVSRIKNGEKASPQVRRNNGGIRPTKKHAS